MRAGSINLHDIVWHAICDLIGCVRLRNLHGAFADLSCHLHHLDCRFQLLRDQSEHTLPGRLIRPPAAPLHLALLPIAMPRFLRHNIFDGTTLRGCVDGNKCSLTYSSHIMRKLAGKLLRE